MGGERETVAEQREKRAGKEIVIGQVRYHESGGEVHFHDDANKLKVAVPVATWHKLLGDLTSGVQRKINYIDVGRKTRLRMKIKGKKKHVTHSLVIESVAFDADLEALHKFTFGA